MMKVTKKELGGPWDWGIVRDLCEAELGDPSGWKLSGNSDEIVVETSLATETLQAAIEQHVIDGPAAWVEYYKDKAAETMNDGKNLRIAILKAFLSELNILRNAHGLAPRTLAQLKNAVRGNM